MSVLAKPDFKRVSRRLASLLLAPALALIMLFTDPPGGLSQAGWGVAAIALWMVIWWITEALPLAATALLPIVLFPLLGLQQIEITASQYAHPLIFLFLGGFLMARAVTAWGLDRRVAMAVMRFVGTSPRRLVGGIMLVTAFLSMWVSNTATAMVMLPIGLSVVATYTEHAPDDTRRLSTALLLGIAYAATIGGIGTIIGTPPNALFAAFMSEHHGIEISFGRWMLLGVPTLLVLLPITWFVLTRHLGRMDGRVSKEVSARVEQQLSQSGSMSTAEYMVTVLLSLVALAWLLRPFITQVFPSANLSDAGIAMLGALLMFVLPVDFKTGRFVLSWQEASEIRWDVLILFGGGLALASAIAQTDLAQWLGTLLSGLTQLTPWLLLIGMGILIVVVGEVASNTAMAAVFLPLAAATALAMDERAITLTLPVALFATLGFMLPVATPPNAIVFGSGRLQLKDMLAVGLLLDVIGIAVVTLMILSIGQWVFVNA